jgi:Putative metal-binding motif
MLWLLVLLPWSAMARSGGIATSSCAGCHAVGSQVTTITLTPSTLVPGSTVTLRVTIRGSGQNGGLYLTTSNGVGTFTVINGQNTRLQNGEVLHSSPKAASGGQVTFDVLWAVPTTPGGTDFSAATVMGNGNGGSSGDQAGGTTLSVVWGCAGTTYYRDFDGDGVGSSASGTTKNCAVPLGYSALDGDCDENDATIAPGRNEVCNGRDDNCNGQIDEGLSATTTWPDLDGDGFGDARGAPMSGCAGTRRAANNLDCDDTVAAVHPGATETCNQRDDNCDGQVDEGARIRCGTGWCARYGPTCRQSDCTPGPPLPERCNDFDDDCDGVIDNGPELCGPEAVCVGGKCLSRDDAGVGSVDAGARDGGVGGGEDSTCSCDAAPALLGVAWLVLALRRRRAAR